MSKRHEDFYVTKLFWCDVSLPSQEAMDAMTEEIDEWLNGFSSDPVSGETIILQTEIGGECLSRETLLTPGGILLVLMTVHARTLA